MVAAMSERIGRRDVLVMAALGLAGVGPPLWLAAAAGAIGIPALDDWVYTQGADSLFRTGRIVMPGHTAAAVGQLVIVQPLLWLSGGAPWAFTAFGLVMALLGIASTYLLARRFVGPGSAVVVVMALLAFPGFARESASFMTDVPAYALAVLCLLLGTRWLQGDGRRLTFVASLAVGLLAVSIREFAVAAPVAVLLAAWARSRADERGFLVGASGTLAAGLACVIIIAASIPGRAETSVPDLGNLFLVGPSFVTLAAVLLPALALAVGPRTAIFSPMQILVGAGLACLAVVVPWGVSHGNLWMQNGVAGDLLLRGIRDSLFSPGVWALSRQVATFAAILLAAVAFSWAERHFERVQSMSGAASLAIRIARRRDGPLILFLVAFAGELVVFSPVWIYDRYLFPVVPVVAILLLRGRAQLSRIGRSYAFSHAALAWLAASAFIVAANSFAYDAARWREGESAVAMGYDARTIDAGYDWVGDHAGVGPSSAPANGMTWDGDRWTLSRPCAVLSNSPLDASALRLIRVDRSAYLNYLFFGPEEPLYLYGNAGDGCPALPAAAAGSTGS